MLDKILTKLGIYGHKRPHEAFGPVGMKQNETYKKGHPHCGVDLCERIVYAKGYCNPHYQRALKLYNKHADRTEWFSVMNKPIKKKKR